MIVDDERIIRDGLATLINWDILSCNLIAIEKNGSTAYNRIMDTAKTTPDIVITDIMMPIMNGLELIEKTLSLVSPPIFIVLSGYNDFEYAKTAMLYGVKYYVLKPTSEEEIQNILKKACEDVNVTRRINEAISISNVKKNTNHDYSIPVSAILDAIDTHIGNPDLSLKWIADQLLFMNESYLSKLFKKEVHKNFSDYLQEKRIAMAKENLLSGNDKKIYEVFELLGFDINTRYFSQVFKKYTGLTPSEYRKKHNNSI